MCIRDRLRIKPLVEQIASDFISLARKGFNPESKLDWIYFWKIEDDFRAIFRDLQEIEQRTRFLSSDFSLPICEAYLNKIESFIRLIYSALYNVLNKEIKKDMFLYSIVIPDSSVIVNVFAMFFKHFQIIPYCNVSMIVWWNSFNILFPRMEFVDTSSIG